MSLLKDLAAPMPSDRQLLTLLDHEIGDDVVYLENTTPWSLYTFAKQLGYIDEEGHMTEKGRQLVNQIRNKV